jgi:hypothetical protein
MRLRLLAVCVMFLCALHSVYTQTQQSLDDAVSGGVRYLQGRFPKGTRAALVAVQSENQEIGEYAYGKFSAALVNGGWFTVVERNAAALERIAREMERHLSFEVSQETELSIGKQLGAEIIISCSLTRNGQDWRLDVQALRVESAQRAAQWSAERIRPDSTWASLASPRSAALSFGGDTVTARDRQTVAAGLRNAMQAYKTGLDLDENSSAQAGYGFTVTVYRAQAAANAGLLQSEVTVAFSRGGRVLCQTATYYITETTEALTARRIAERLRGDRDFFNRVNEVIR